MSQQSTIVIRNSLQEMHGLWREFEELADRWRLPALVSHAVQLCLDELVTNIISYGYDDGAEHEIAIAFAREGDDLTVTLTDDARPFDPLAMADPDVSAPLEERAIGGLGIFFVRKMMDDVRYEYRDGMNVLTLRKNINGLIDD